MRILTGVRGLCLAVTMTGPALAASEPVDWVNPLIGTGSANAKDPVPGGSGGSVFPGAAVPFGMVQFSPDTPKGEPSGYGYADHSITGFSFTHFSGAGCANNAELPILPTVGSGDMSSSIDFRHDDEQASPGYYRVLLANGVGSELTVTPHSGFGRFTFPEGRQAHNLLIDAARTATGRTAAHIELLSDHEMTGSIPSGNFCGTGNQYTVYFVASFDHPFALAKEWAGGALLNFGYHPQTTVQVKVGLSYVSVANAHSNLLAENPAWDFDGVHAAARDQWNHHLKRIAVRGGSPAQSTKFYTALYHSLLHPNVFSDVNGDYMGFDQQVHQAVGRVQYANYSGWDIYRSEIPLLALLYPERANDIAQSLVEDAKQCGALPKWSHNNSETGVMVGDPGAAILANAYAFGAREFDTQRALAFMIKSGTEPGTACGKFVIRPGLKEYLDYQFIPEGTENVWGSVSTDLEYSTADFAVAQFAAALHDEPTARTFKEHALYWRHHFDPASGYLRPLLSSGECMADHDFSAVSTKGFVEGSAGQYLWTVPQDPVTLFHKVGGNDIAISRMDEFFTELNTGISSAHFYAGNEPGFASPWLYPWAGAPSRTQDVVRRIIDGTFGVGPDGLPGNDDLGAMSSWYVWAALGLYPAVPGVPGLVISAPSFPEVHIELPGDHQLTIAAPQAAELRYVRDLRLGDQLHDQAWLDLERISAGGKLEFTMSEQPTAWGTKVPPPVLVDSAG